MNVERKALYNSLRMNWLLHPDMLVEPWQVEDYRKVSLEGLFERLRLQDIEIDRISFLALADEYESPEELTEHLTEAMETDQRTQDQTYLLIFELWRRLLPEKPTLSIFCDELDYQIQQYDEGKVKDLETMQDMLANLKMVLDENVDQGGDPTEVFHQVSAECANDVRNFLYDFIGEQIDENHLSYAGELLDSFEDYIQDGKWFDLLRMRQLCSSDPEEVQHLLRKIILKSAKTSDLPFNLEILSHLAQTDEEKIFLKLLKATIPLLETEEDFQDLLFICSDFYQLMDKDVEEEEIQKILESRSRIPLEKKIDKKDPAFLQLIKLMKSAIT